MKTAIALGIIFCFAGCASRSEPPTVSGVDLARYQGRWHEIARLPNFFQRHCAGEVTADYTEQPDGSIRVVNRCVRADGKPEQVVGKAKPVAGSGNAKLRVNFGIPFATGDYWILALDDRDYQWSLVGHPSRKYLWILSRTPTMDDALYARIVARAVALGYDASQIERTPGHIPASQGQGSSL